MANLINIVFLFGIFFYGDCVLSSLSEKRYNSANTTYINTCQVIKYQIVGQWSCANGQLINCADFCNGRVDCSDLSDENALSCRYNVCSNSGFRCSYGGCIRSDQECDGIIDCADKSDETTHNCPGILSQYRHRGNCPKGLFQCKSGRCIFEEEMCNGRADCEDSSDETEELCSTHFCPERAFRCNYGACIPFRFRCDNKIDCIDGSDENHAICGLQNSLGPVQPPASYGQSTMKPNHFPIAFSTTKPPLPPPPKSTSLPIAPQRVGEKKDPQNGLITRVSSTVKEYIFRHVKEIFSNSTKRENFHLQFNLEENPGANSGDGNIPNPTTDRPTTESDEEEEKDGGIDKRLLKRDEGDCDFPYLQNGVVEAAKNENGQRKFIKNGEFIKYTCLDDNHLTGHNLCADGSFSSKFPTCTKMCSGLVLETLSVQAQCKDSSGTDIACDELLPPGTIAILFCKVGYKKEDPTVSDTLRCMETGRWSGHVYACDRVCGEVSEGQQLIIGGTESNVTQVPWHAAVYELQSQYRMEQICGGSIVSPTAVVSAAHCFWSLRLNQIQNHLLYKVAVGKSRRSFDAEEYGVQMFQVKSIKTFPQYLHYEGLFMADIAVLRLDRPIVYQLNIKPICVDFKSKHNQVYIPSGLQGRVAGFGFKEADGEPSPILKILDIPTVDYHTCRREVPQSFIQYLTSDKFCAGSKLGQNVCKGDSGGGLAIPKWSEDGRSMAYFLRGIVSVGPSIKMKCDLVKYTAFTDVSQAISLLYGIEDLV